jgi:signal transduction histidine kinase/ActR/RegA family two-component response regulator
MVVSLSSADQHIMTATAPGAHELVVEERVASGEDARRRERRLYRLNARIIPGLRSLGLTLVLVGVVLHNALVTGEVVWGAVAALAVASGVYGLVSWLVLRRWYRPGAAIDLGVAFLGVDIVFLALAVYITGADQSWIFWIFLLRVADQTTSSFRRTLGFSALAVLGYLAVLLYAAGPGGHSINWSTELAKLLLLLLASLYIASGARPAERLRKRLGETLNAARHYAAQLEVQSTQLESAREQAEAGSRAKSEFLSRVSHELRTPMNAILGFGQLLEMERLSDDQQTYVGEILESGRHLLDVINEVLDISRVETGALSRSLEPVHLGAALRDVLERAARAAELRDVDLPQEPPSGSDVWVRGNDRKLRQVFANLLSNAIKYNSSPGTVRLTCLVDAGRARVAVTDTGPGLAPEDIQTAFAPFQRLRPNEHTTGTGLGLSVARSLLHAMGGEIGVDTEPGAGSTFWVDLKLARAPDSADTETHMPDPDAPRGPLVLYIDDRPENILLVRRILARRPGVELIDVPVGLKGIELARSRLPDLILLDLELPDISGNEVLERLREDPRTLAIPVVVVSAQAAPDRIERLLARGARAYFTMPYDVGKFLDVVDEVLDLTGPTS